MDSKNAIVIVVLVVGAVLAYAIYQWGRQLAVSRKTRAELTTNEEYRRLSEMAVTAQEHTDLKSARSTCSSPSCATS